MFMYTFSACSPPPPSSTSTGQLVCESVDISRLSGLTQGREDGGGEGKRKMLQVFWWRKEKRD